MKLKAITILFLLGTLCLAAASATALEQQQILSGKVIRLHVLANSDSEEDQRVKQHVKDELMEYISRVSWETKDDAASWFEANKKSIKELCMETLRICGCDTKVNVEIGAQSYLSRFGDLGSLPAGEYLSLRVILGEGQGQNWWCVVYPNLTSETELTEREKKIVLQPEKTKISFAILECLQKIKISLQDT